jgi:hypothetical protein
MPLQRDCILGKGKESKEFARFLIRLAYRKIRQLLRFQREELLMLKIEDSLL